MPSNELGSQDSFDTSQSSSLEDGDTSQSSNLEDGLEPIAVVGFSIGFPQEATSAEAFWEIMMKKKSTATNFPKSRMNIDSMYHPDASRRGQISVSRSHFLDRDIASFDAPFFTTSTTDAASMDPQQRLLLEYTYKALENAGMSMESVSGSKTSVYTGSFSTDYQHLAFKDPEQCATTTALGVQSCFNANRVSWFFNFTGNSANIDTACSSSLVALDLGCQGLRSRDENMSIVGGANVILSPDNMHTLTNLNMLSPDGQCYSFDHRANGYSRGEGFGVLVLKRVSDAIRDNDTIRGIIRSTGSNQCGNSPSITLPSSIAQDSLIRQTYRKASLSMEPTRFFEAHGTGTPVGDPAEAKALGSVFQQARTKEDPLWVGAVKSNIGHLEGASGIAGVIKALLVLEKGIIPPNANFEKLNPKIDMEFLRIKFPLEPTPWPTKGLRRASVNSFGNAGTNADYTLKHVVLDDVFHFLEERGLAAHHLTVRDPPATVTTQCSLPKRIVLPLEIPEQAEAIPKILLLSAFDQPGIRRQAQAFTSYFSNLVINADQWQTYINDLAFTLSFRRSSFPWKSFAVVKSLSDLLNLEQILSPATRSITEPRLGFIFTGQGAQWRGMGRELLQFPVFQRSLAESEEALSSIGCPWRLREEILKEKDSCISRPDFSQPICTALQIALIHLLRHFNIHPTTVIGHSSGEIAAAYSTGAISAKSGLKLAYYRGTLAGFLATSEHNKGGMMSVGLSKIRVMEYLEKVSKQCGSCGLTVACINSPNNVTISGDVDQIAVLKSLLDSDNIFTRRLVVDVAYHSPHMQAIAKDYFVVIKDIERGDIPLKPITMISTVTGEIVSRETLLSPDYWVLNLISPVQFVDAVKNLLSRSGQKVSRKLDLSHRNYFHISMLVEIGPHSVLQGPINDILNDAQGTTEMSYTSVLIRQNSAITSFLNAMGQLKCLGCPVDMRKINHPGSKDQMRLMALSDLPEYVFDLSKQYWFESRLSARYRLHHQGKLDLLGKPVPDWNPMEPRWRNILRVTEMPWMEDHIINGSMIYPGAGMLVMAIEAANQLSDGNVTGFNLKEISFIKPLNISEASGGIETQLSLRMTQGTSRPLSRWTEFRLFAYDQDSWQECCHGHIRVEYEADVNEVSLGREEIQELEEHRQMYDSFTQSCQEPLNPEVFYEMLGRNGLKYGPSFLRVVGGSYGNQSQVQGRTELFEWPEKEYPQAHIIHPTSLDAILHLPLAGCSKGGTIGMPTVIPTFLQGLFVSKDGLQFSRGNNVHECAWKIAEDSLAIHFSGFVLDSSKSKILARFEDLKTTMIGALLEDPNNSTSSSSHQRSYNFEYQPDPELLSENEIQEYCQQGLHSNQNAFDRYIDVLSHQNSNLKILEIGAERKGLTAEILKTLSIYNNAEKVFHAKYNSYCYAAVDPSILDDVEKDLQGYPRLTFEHIVVETDPLKQGFEANAYDIILAPMKLSEDVVFVRNTRKLLSAAGNLMFHGQPQTDGLNAEHSLSLKSSGLLSKHGFIISPLQLSALGGIHVHVTSLIAEPSPASNKKSICIISDPDSSIQTSSAKALANILRSQGLEVMQATLPEARKIDRLEDIVFITLIELDNPFIYLLSQENYYLLKEFLIAAPSILWVNSYGGSPAGNPEYALIQGLARVLRNEYDDHSLTILSFESQGILSERQLQRLAKILMRNHIYHTELGAATQHVEYVEVQGLIHTPRLVLDEPLTRQLQMKPTQSCMSLFQGSPPLKMIMQSPGLLDSFRFIEDEDVSRPLADDEIEVRTYAIGMNFKDCLIALGRIPNGKLGQECAGVVTRTGSNTRFLLGDRVVMIAYEGYRTFARGKAHSAYKIPHSMAFTTAAALPSQFGTAWGVIHGVARLQSHESILIHAAAGGTGQAAIQLAKLIGATIFATVGSASKKQILIDEYQIPEEHIFYSRDVNFAKGIKRLTGGRGVDVVINSLVGDGLIASWECIAPFGRFVEIGKKDILENSSLPMSLFAKNASFIGFDGNLWEQQSNDFELIIDMFTNNVLHLPRPFEIYSLSQVEEVFNVIKGGKFAGKIVMEVTPDTSVPATLNARPSFYLDSNATYVIAGGLGGIGRTTARWMVGRGARNLILLSRYGPRTVAAQELLEEIRSQGVRVETPACDITHTELMREIIESLSSNMPPIKGCVQASILQMDELFRDMNYESWKPAVDCKAIGSWNLHSTLPSGMDFFILLASASGVAGIRGQANYNAGNVYEDAIARYRVSKGEKAISLDLGAMIDDGILTENQALLERVLTYGTLEPITREQYFTMLDYYCNPALPLLSPTASQSAIGLGAGGGSGLETFDYSRIPMLYPLVVQYSTQAMAADGQNQADYREMIAASASFDEAGEIVTQAIIDKLAKSLSVMQDSTSIDRNKPLQMYGVDSLLAIELRNWIVKEFLAEIAVFETQGVSTLETLSRLVAGRSSIKHDKWTVWGDVEEE